MFSLSIHIFPAPFDFFSPNVKKRYDLGQVLGSAHLCILKISQEEWFKIWIK